MARSIKLQLIKKSKATTFALVAHALLIESMNTLLMVFARSRDDGKWSPGDYAKKTIKSMYNEQIISKLR